MRITEAARRLGTSPRMLRYRDRLGLLPPVRPAHRARGHGPVLFPAVATPVRAGGHRPPAARATGHRQFSDDDLATVALALRIEQRYDITPAALAFGLKVLTDAGARGDVAELGRRLGRVGPLPARALEFEKERALRLLQLAPDRPSRGQEPRPR